MARTTGRATEIAITARTLGRVRHAALRADAEAALARGEPVRLVEGGAGGARVETVVVGGGRAGQSAGAHVTRGVWTGARLAADAGGHLLDADGVCFCRDCEAAQGYCVDDDE
jgi:hypothetical protein